MTGAADVLVSALEQAQGARVVVLASVCKRGRHRWTVVEKTVEPTTLDKLLVHYRCADCGTEEVRRV